MASKFATQLVDRLLKDRDRLTMKIARTTVDIALLDITPALAHARTREHTHLPAACELCRQLERVIADLKIH